MATTRTVTFVQNQLPGLQSGNYTVTATVAVNQAVSGTFKAEKRFAVAGGRFHLAGDDMVAVFPPHLANGSFDGVLPHVVLRRPSLPWRRSVDRTSDRAPWLAVLLFGADTAPRPRQATVADLVPQGTPIAGPDGKILGSGTMPDGLCSSPGLTTLEFGESPGDTITCVDIDAAGFAAMAPTLADLELLAHVRVAPTADSEDTPESAVRRAVVMANRVPVVNGQSVALLVSLEGCGPLLPTETGPSPSLDGAIRAIRLVVLGSWRFFVNDLDQTFQKLLENLTRDSHGDPSLTALRLPGPTPSAEAVTQALAAQAAGRLTDTQADVLVQTALAQGYVPMDHALRQSGHTVSWYRGPLVPLAFPKCLDVPLPGPDAALRYDSQTGLFDASYAAAWQLGQLLALQNQSFSATLSRWKGRLRRVEAARVDRQRFIARLGRTDILAGPLVLGASLAMPDVPQAIADFLGELHLLRRVPFAYLVPDERMLPPESIRVFQLDPNWIEALVDGACSIGRVTGNDLARDAARLPLLRRQAARAMLGRRTNHPPHLAARLTALAGKAATPAQAVSGFLVRSQVVSGWPRLDVNVYGDTHQTVELPKLRMERLSQDVLLCLVAGRLCGLAIHEPPEQLHCGIDNGPGNWVTILRAVTDANPAVHPGEQLLDGDRFATAPILTRADGYTLRAAQSAQGLLSVLNTRFAQDLKAVTSEKWTLQMVKGVLRVDFTLGT